MSPVPASAAIPDHAIQVSIISDLVCPWSYIGTREICHAIERVKLSAGTLIDFKLEHKPYLLNVSLSEGECKPRLENIPPVLRERGEKVGIKFASNGVVSCTMKAHRLLLQAWRKGGSEAQFRLLNALYKATFEQGDNIGDVEVLATRAEETGLMSKKEAVDFLESEELKTDVQRMVVCAQRHGVSGVPLTVINGRWAISGGQSSEVYYEVFQKLVQGKEP